LRAVTDKPAEELAAMVGGNQTELGRQLLLLPAGLPMKYLVAIRIVSALMFEPSGSLWRAIAETEQLDVLDERLSALERRGVP